MAKFVKLAVHDQGGQYAPCWVNPEHVVLVGPGDSADTCVIQTFAGPFLVRGTMDQTKAALSTELSLN